MNSEDAKLILQMGISLDGFVAISSDNGLTPIGPTPAGLPPEDPELRQMKLDRV